MTTPRFTFRLRNGQLVGPVSVHGSGGAVVDGAERRVRLAIERATDGRDFAGACSIYEPCIGHVSAWSADRIETLVDLRGATIATVSL